MCITTTQKHTDALLFPFYSLPLHLLQNSRPPNFLTAHSMPYRITAVIFQHTTSGLQKAKINVCWRHVYSYMTLNYN